MCRVNTNATSKYYDVATYPKASAIALIAVAEGVQCVEGGTREVLTQSRDNHNNPQKPSAHNSIIDEPHTALN